MTALMSLPEPADWRPSPHRCENLAPPTTALDSARAIPEHNSNMGDGSLGRSMSFRIMILVLALSLTPYATAQDVSERKTYFLIDASGSMQKRAGALSAALDAKRKEIANQARGPIETRFGGENGGVCGTPVVIGTTETGKFRDDRTQLGAALESALQDAGDSPADIFIFTDEEQTPGCGPDICTVAERYLPKPGIFVQSIPIEANPVDHNRLSCIRAAQQVRAQASPFFSLTINVDHYEPQTVGANAAGEHLIDWDQASPFERWHWLLVCLLFTWAAFSVGSFFGRRAHLFEAKTEHINKKLRIAASQKLDGSTTENELAGLSASDLEPPNEDKSSAKEWRATEWVWSSWVSGVVALTLLLLLLAWETSWTLWNLGEYFHNARALGWSVISSSFSNFALIIAAPVFFAGAQHWRFTQAKRTFALVTNSATTAERDRQARRLAKKLDNLHAQSLRMRQSILDTKFASPVVESLWSSSRLLAFGRPRRAATLDTSAEDFELISAKARELAVGEELPREGLTEAVADREIKRLSKFAPSIGETLFKIAKISTFLSHLVEQDSRPKTHANEWEDLANQTANGTATEIKASMKKLASLLRAGP